jgi:ComF family protein
MAYGSYDGGLKEFVHLLKFEQVRPAAGVLGRMLAEVIRRLEPSLPEAAISVVPVPLHSRKQSQRGFNQADLVTRAALKRLAMPDRFRLVTNALVRRRETDSQIGLTRHQRRENLRGAFAVTDPTSFVGKNILLVDDVFTTGTTVSECAKVLRRAGASTIWVVTVARTLRIADALAVPEHLEEGEKEERQMMAAHI